MARSALCLALALAAADRGEVSFLQRRWPGDGLELCEVTGHDVRPESTCADFGDVELSSSCRLKVQMTVLRGETETAQLLLRLPSTLSRPSGGAFLSMKGFAVPRGVRCNVEQVGYVFTNTSGREPGSGGGWRADPLRELSSTFLPSNTAQALAVSCSVDAAAAGPHAAELALTLEPGGPFCVSVTLKVLNASIPSLKESSIGMAWRGEWKPEAFEPYYGAGYWENFERRRSWFDLMLSQRIPPDRVGKMPRPFEDFIYLSGQGMKWLGLLDVGAYSSKKSGGCPVFSDEDLREIRATLHAILFSLKRRGLDQRGYVYGFDEVPENCEEELRRVFGSIKKIFEVKTMAAINWKHVPLDLPLDVWVLQYQLFNPEAAAKWVEAKKELWLYHCIEPSGLQYLNTFVERPTLQGRLLFWLAALWELEHGAPTGWLYWLVNAWRPCNAADCGGAVARHPLRWGNLSLSTAFTDWSEANFIWQKQGLNTIFANGDGQLLYPCDGPCGSLRLHAIRDGLEDWELFRRLAVHEKSKAIALLRRVVQSPTSWQPQLLRPTRLEALQLLAV